MTQRLGETICGVAGLVCGELSGGGDLRLELRGVEHVVRRQHESISRRVSHDVVLADQAAQVRDVGVQRCHRSVIGSFAPYLGDQRVNGDRAPTGGDQHCQHRQLAGATEDNRAVGVDRDRVRAHAELHATSLGGTCGERQGPLEVLRSP